MTGLILSIITVFYFIVNSIRNKGDSNPSNSFPTNSSDSVDL